MTVYPTCSSDMAYGSRYTLDDVVESMKRNGVGLKGNETDSLYKSSTK